MSPDRQSGRGEMAAEKGKSSPALEEEVAPGQDGPEAAPRTFGNEAVLLALMERTGYSLLQENGQRKYGGPPPDWEGPTPPKGCEVFVGKIPRDCFEDELVPLFEQAGRIYELRLMMDFSGSNRGYAFVMYTDPGDASRAIRELNNCEVRRGRHLGVVRSVDNCRLFVGGIPRSKKQDEVHAEMARLTDGVVRCIVYTTPGDKNLNRGFAFVEYDSHRAAAMARRKLLPGKIELWGNQIAVDWAEPEPDIDEDIMAKVTTLYVRNLMLKTTEDQIREAFESDGDAGVEKVKKVRDFAFVHFRTREQAQKALEATNGTELDGSIIEVAWSKPVDKQAYRLQKALSRGAYYPSYNSNMPNHSPYMAGFQQPQHFSALPCGHNGIAPCPLLCSPVRGRSRGAAGLRGGRGISANLGHMNFSKRGHEMRMYDLQPGMELIPTNPFTLRPTKSAVQILQDVCSKNNWGEPIYELHSTLQRNQSGSDTGIQLFLYKVTLPGCMTPYNVFQPNKLCARVEDAKNHAAEHTLSQLGVPNEGIPPATAQSRPCFSPSSGIHFSPGYHSDSPPITCVHKKGKDRKTPLRRLYLLPPRFQALADASATPVVSYVPQVANVVYMSSYAPGYYEASTAYQVSTHPHPNPSIY